MSNPGSDGVTICARCKNDRRNRALARQEQAQQWERFKMHKRVRISHALLGATAAVALQFLPASAKADIASFEIGTTAELTANNTVAIVSGTVACSFGEVAQFTVQILQPSGRSIGIGSNFDVEVDCAGVPVLWEVPVAIQIGQKWKNGPADAQITITTEDPITFQQTDTVLADVTLRLHK